MENSMEVPQKYRVAIWSSNLTPRHKPGQNYSLKRCTYPCVHSSTTHNSQDMEKTWKSIDRWMDKEDVVYICNAILLSHKKRMKDAICNIMDTPRDYHMKWSRSERKTKTMCYYLYVKSKVRHKWTYQQNRDRLTDIKNRLVAAKGEWGGEAWTGSLGLADANYYI